MGSLDGKVAIVTGGSSGIGEAIARRFVSEGAQVVLVGRRPAKDVGLLREIPADRVAYSRGDTIAPNTSQDSVELALTEFGRLDILVNNAATQPVGRLLSLETSSLLATARSTFEVNFFGPLAMLLASARAMLQTGGSIINITSRTATVGVAELGIYGASKGALFSLTRAAAIELAHYGIRVNAVAPGLVETPPVSAWAAKETQADWAKLVERIPQSRIGQPEEVAAAVLFLASDEAAHVTGVSLAVDGGYTAS